MSAERFNLPDTTERWTPDGLRTAATDLEDQEYIAELERERMTRHTERGRESASASLASALGQDGAEETGAD